MPKGKTLKIWLKEALPVRITIKNITYEIRRDVVEGGPGEMYLEAARLDSGRCIKLAELPAPSYKDEYFRHAHFESLPGTPARKLADALIAQGLAVLEPDKGWLFTYEKSVPWESIALGCEFHKGGWHVKESEEESHPLLNGYLIRY